MQSLLDTLVKYFDLTKKKEPEPDLDTVKTHHFGQTAASSSATGDVSDIHLNYPFHTPEEPDGGIHGFDFEQFASLLGDEASLLAILSTLDPKTLGTIRDLVDKVIKAKSDEVAPPLGSGD